MLGSLMAGVLVAMQVATGGGGAGRGQIRMTVLQAPVLLTAPLTGADGSRRGPAADISRSGGALYVASAAGSCDAAISSDLPVNVRDGWKVTARLVAQEMRTATVAVEWQRMWAAGRPVTNGTSGTSEIVLRSGDRVPLDHLETTAAGLDCHGRTRTLELSMWNNVINRPPDRPTTAPPVPVKMEVWLVHHTPAGEETTYALAVPFAPAESRFVFRTQPIVSFDGTYHVDLDGHARAVAREDGSLELWVGIRRAIIDTSTGVVRVGSGSGGSLTAWPQPGEVLSFDLPAPFGGAAVAPGGRGVAAGGTHSGTHTGPAALPLTGHRFSVRFRFTPLQVMR
jgi:hypothetical protein